MSNIKYLFVGAVFLHLLSLFFSSDVGYQMAIAPLAIGALAAAGGAALSDITNQINKSNAQYSVDLQKQLMNYQWNNFNSPAAQAKALADAGMNPSVVFGQGSNFASPSVSAPALSPVDIGLSGANLSQSLLALSQAKKAGIDTSLGEEDIKLKQIQQDRDNFELDLRKKYGLQQSAADLALAQENVNLAKLSGDKIEIEKAIMQYTKAKEKALSECEETRRGILEKELQNTDKRLQLENRVLTTQGDANIASANASNASANASNASAELSRSQTKFQNLVNDIKESAKTFELESLIHKYRSDGKVSDADAEKAINMLNRYKHLNENDKNAAAEYLNYTFWFIKEHMPSLPIVPFLKLGK